MPFCGYNSIVFNSLRERISTRTLFATASGVRNLPLRRRNRRPLARKKLLSKCAIITMLEFRDLAE